MTDLIKEFDIINKKAHKYDDLLNRLNIMADKLNQATNLINEVIIELNPTMPKERAYSGINYLEIAEEFYAKMQAGLTITTDLIMRTYPEWNYQQCQTVLKHIIKMPNVDTRKEGRTIFYFCKNDFRS